MATQSIEFHLNGRPVRVEIEGDTPLLWVIRDHLGHTGTKYSCGIGVCGSCTVHVAGEAVPSCTVPVAAIEGKEVTTIEGVAAQGGRPVMEAWIAEEVSQCGYCQPGMIMSAVALLRENSNPTHEEIERSMTNLCRCGTYNRVHRAIRRAADAGEGGTG